MTPAPGGALSGLPDWSLRLKAPVGRLPLGAIFGTIGVLGAGAVGLLGLDRLPFPVCLFKAFTGFACPTCGSTRAVGRLVHFDLAGALVMNPLTTLAAFVFAIWAVADFSLLSRGRALDLEMGRPLGRVVRAVAVVAVVANWAYLVVSGR